MPGKRQSDENSNPDQELNQKNKIKLEKTNKPLLQSNEETDSKKKLSTFEKRERERFSKSGMKKGSLLKYFVKGNPEDMNGPSVRNRSSSACSINSSVYNPRTIVNANATRRNEENGDQTSQSQDSDIEYLGSVPHGEANVISLEGDGDDSDSVSQEQFDADSPQVSDYDDEEGNGSDNDQQEDVESVISSLDGQELSGEAKIVQWQRQNKRMLQDDEPVAKNNNELQPPPAKASRLDFSVKTKELISHEQCTPEKPLSQESNTSTPPLRIVNVFTLSGKDATPSTSSGSTSSTAAVEKAKKSIFMYKEFENPNMLKLIEKKIWRKVVETMNADLQNYKLPAKIYMSQLIRKAIFCEDSRIPKDVQADSLKLLEEIMQNYPPYNGNGRDLSIKYYKEILEKVFDQGNRGNKLNVFLTEVHKRLQSEKNALQVFILVTQLVVNQYEVYEKEVGVKVHPPLFQYFLEENEGVFRYNQYCKSIVNKCCNAKIDEEFCIYLKWVDLISQRLGKFPARQNDYLQMIRDTAKRCLAESDLGLLLLMNISYKLFSKSVCEVIFRDKLKVVRADGNHDEVVSEEDRTFYLSSLSKTLLIKPAGDMVSDVIEEACKVNASLTFKQLRVNSTQINQPNREYQSRGRRINVKGETRLHILCRPGHDNPVREVRKHLESYPEDVNLKDNFGNTPLHDCAKNNKGNVIIIFMQLFEKRKLNMIDFLARNESLETPMHLAATYCDPQTTELFKYFATCCGVIDEVLTSANKNGKLPFELAPANTPIQRKLTPSGYDKKSMLRHGGFTLNKKSVEILENSFELRKLLAWWSQSCL